MDDTTILDTLWRIKLLEQGKARFRRGVVSAVSPNLQVKLGGESTAYTNVVAVLNVSTPLSVGDSVACLQWGGDLIVIGAIKSVISASEAATARSSLGVTELAYICIQDQKAANTAGGGFTSGAWRTRDLNTEVADAGGNASLSANQITLAAGTYRCRISAPAFITSTHKTRLRNVTDSTTVLVGTSELTPTTAGVMTRSFIEGRFTIAAGKALEVQHQCAVTRAGDGFGQASNFGEVEVYAIAELWKE